jgi:hypothetical protein
MGLAELRELVEQAKDVVTVRRVFGEPVQQDRVTIIPVAHVAGGGGRGGGDARNGGFGFRASPAGVFTIQEGRVTWQPAVDVNRAILGGQLVALALLLVARSLLKGRARRLAG